MNLKKFTFKFLKSWLPLAVAIIAICGLVYLTVQQVLRQGANDPQIQLSEDLAASFASSKSPSGDFPSRQVEISTSLAPFVMIFDDNGKVLISNALLDGKTPQYPEGVFEYVRQHGQDRVTWQPREGVRHATVVTRYSGPAGSGFVVAGRSLREVEERSMFFLWICVIACLMTLLATAAVTAFLLVLFERKKSSRDKTLRGWIGRIFKS
jgi:hypothetical protein